MALMQSSMVPLGTAAHDFTLKGIDGKSHSLVDYKEAKVLVVVFMCNHCPYVQAIWDDLVALSKQSATEVQFIGINSNANPNYPEDSFEKMKEYAALKGQDFPYLFDEDQAVAQAYKAQCTPDIFAYSSSRELRYRGAFSGLAKAIECILNNEEAPMKQDHSIGCSIKWM
jgi:peroxiredoxin